MPIGMQPSPRGNRVERLIISLDTTRPILCAWLDCDRYARTTYQVRVHEHRGDIGCTYVNEAGGAYGRHMIYAFCCEGHLDYWTACSGQSANDLAARYQGRISGMHSPGMRRTII